MLYYAVKLAGLAAGKITFKTERKDAMGVQLTNQNLQPASQGAPHDFELNLGSPPMGGLVELHYGKSDPHDRLDVDFHVKVLGGNCDWGVSEGAVDHGQATHVITNGAEPVTIAITPTADGPVELEIRVECADPSDPLSDGYLVRFDVPAAPALTSTGSSSSSGSSNSSSSGSPSGSGSGSSPSDSDNKDSSAAWLGCGGLAIALAIFALAAVLCSGGFTTLLGLGLWHFGNKSQPAATNPTTDTTAAPILIPEGVEVEEVNGHEYLRIPCCEDDAECECEDKPDTKTVTVTGYRVNGRACYTPTDAEYLRQALGSPTLPPHVYDGPFVCFDDDVAADMLAQLGYHYTR